MKERLTRLKTIRKLIKTYRIESQEALLGYLSREGYAVTQATLSRDLKLLKVGKVSDGNNGYVYVLPSDEDRQESEQTIVQDFLRGYISLEYSGNMVVIKTYSGHSDVVATAIDSMGFDEVLGSVSGRDNCVFLCLREGISGADFLETIKLKIPELDD
ncbi:MAG TPA: ArgR family transcriptional regulator [Treponema sp.]|nr:ArgR family transcriptional regulator [Treponema sp.]